MNKLLYIISIISGIVIVTCFFSSCDKADTTEFIPTTISDIAYNKNSNYGYMVYLFEDEKPTPYFVVTDNYNGNTLLMRQNTITKLKPFNDYSSYYRNSDIDVFLNNDFFNVFSTTMKSKVVETNVEITAESALNTHGNQTEIVKTKIFLLSFEELDFGAKSSGIATIEGKKLYFFDNVNNRIAYNDNNEISAWWLRTPDTGYLSCSFVVSSNGKVGSVNSYNKNAVRPVFCIKNDTILNENSDIISGKTVFVIE